MRKEANRSASLFLGGRLRSGEAVPENHQVGDDILDGALAFDHVGWTQVYTAEDVIIEQSQEVHASRVRSSVVSSLHVTEELKEDIAQKGEGELRISDRTGPWDLQHAGMSVSLTERGIMGACRRYFSRHSAIPGGQRVQDRIVVPKGKNTTVESLEIAHSHRTRG